MKKLSIFMSMILCVSCVVAFERMTAEARGLETVIESKVGRVIKGGGLSKIVLIGTFHNKSFYAENIRVEVRDAKTDKVILTIKPTTNGGYKPSILLENFKTEESDGLNQIFLGMDSGGSGGFGYFYVFDVESGKAEAVFDYEKWDKTYSATYENNYKVKIAEENSPEPQSFIIDISSRPNDYLNEIYNQNGTLKTLPTLGDVSFVNYVFPYYSSLQGKFLLQVFQRITGRYNADGLGYVVTFLDIYNKNPNENSTFVGFYGNS